MLDILHHLILPAGVLAIHAGVSLLAQATRHTYLVPALDLPGNAWGGLMAPPKTPSHIVQKLNATVNDILRAPETKAALDKFNALLLPKSVDEFAAYIARETPPWSAITPQASANVMNEVPVASRCG